MDQVIEIWEWKLRMHKCFYTYLRIVTAVVPLQKQSKMGCNLSSLSITSKSRRWDSFYATNILDSSLCTSPSESLHNLFESTTSKSLLFAGPGQSAKSSSSHWFISKLGRESLTLLLTKCPYGPWPSKTPRKLMFSSDPKCPYDPKFWWKQKQY